MRPLIYCFLPNISVIRKKQSSEVSIDSDINYMPVVAFLECLGVCAYLISNKILSKSTDS